jgi:spore maturation protein A
VLKIVEDTKLDQKIAKLLKPVIHFLMGKFDQETENQIAINLTSNLFGMGNASTPSGINAIVGMYKGEKVATSAMLMFLILNTTNLQIVPTTIIGLRIFNGSANPNDIILPTLIASCVSTISGILLIKQCGKIFKKRKKT